MKHLFILSSLVAALWGCITPCEAQTSEEEAAKKEAQKTAGVTPGVPLPTGLGFLTNPDNFHRFTVGIQAGLGVSANSATFGYDNLSVNSKWRLGNNKFGKRLHALVGFSDWREPAYRKVFADSVIDPLPDQERFAAKSANAASVGLAYSVGREELVLTAAQLNSLSAYQVLISTPQLPIFLLSSAAAGEPLTSVEQEEVRLLTGSVFYSPPTLTAPQLAALTAAGFTTDKQANWLTNPATKKERQAMLAAGIDPALVNSLSTVANTTALQEGWTELRAKFLRRAYHDNAREAAFSLGVLIRAASFAEETNIQAFDSYITYAKGYKTCDFVVAAHGLRYIEKSLPRYALTAAAGVFIDLDDDNIFPVLGLTTSYGYYAFRELDSVIPEAAKRNRDPNTKRWDVLLSIAGAPDKTNQTGAGLGVRYSYVNPNLLPAHHSFSLVFSSNFSLIK